MEPCVVSLGRRALDGDVPALREILETPPTVLMWWMHRRIEPENLPPTRTLIECRFTRPSETIWLLVERRTMSVCVQHPGGDVDLVTPATAQTFGQVFSGRRRWHEAVGSGDIVMSGPPRLMRALPTWFTWSPWADLTQGARWPPATTGAGLATSRGGLLDPTHGSGSPGRGGFSDLGEWRVRTGDYRIVYEIHDDVLLVLVWAVGHRRDTTRPR